LLLGGWGYAPVSADLRTYATENAPAPAYFRMYAAEGDAEGETQREGGEELVKKHKETKNKKTKEQKKEEWLAFFSPECALADVAAAVEGVELVWGGGEAGVTEEEEEEEEEEYEGCGCEVCVCLYIYTHFYIHIYILTSIYIYIYSFLYQYIY
jgi:hypothetical protein